MGNGIDGGGLNASLISSLPVWARLVVIFGPTTAFAGILLLALLGLIPSPMTKMLEQQTSIVQVLQSHDGNSIQLRRELLAAIEYQNLLSRTLCRNMVPAQVQFQCEPRYRGYDEKN